MSLPEAFNTVSEATSVKHNVILEPMLLPNPRRFVIMPIKYNDIWQFYKKSVASFWTAEEVNFAEDVDEYKLLSKDEQKFISYILAFFITTDGTVNENIVQDFCDEIQIPEARCFYGMEITKANIHLEMDTLLLCSFVEKTPERHSLLEQIKSLPEVRKKSDWIGKWIRSSGSTFSERLVAFTVLEGVFPCMFFASIFWLKKRGILPGLIYSNELIYRDTCLQTDFGCLIFKNLKEKPCIERVTMMIEEAVQIITSFFSESLPIGIIGIEVQKMSEYIRFVADCILIKLGYERIYSKANPFEFMENKSVDITEKIYDKQSGEYQRALNDVTNTFTIDADF